MLSYQQIKSFPLIYDDAEGEDIRTVHDILIDPKNADIKAFVYEDSKVDTRDTEESVPPDTINHVTESGLGIQASSVLPSSFSFEGEKTQDYFINANNIWLDEEALRYTGVTRMATEQHDLISLEFSIGNPVFNEENDKIGKINDVYLDMVNKKVSSFKVSGGLWDQLFGTESKELIHIKDIISINTNGIVMKKR
ncbi:hypothetical protein GMB86_11045 [Terrilactibacillus sp. BCM23-1]|uniref:PRC-barrel domain-containing protein n=1 Tax=Terrilactibacillus tamarindi TaxID=2599694 RepID=A0A6N8CTX8_9BACI|nr:PRC-barrel domain-containing protein [Terrilactibacillus tamarindi]MTT32543.1 hypothetical protein [Terrilactibacillus tamarindi]